jgi:hypothetical protein
MRKYAGPLIVAAWLGAAVANGYATEPPAAPSTPSPTPSPPPPSTTWQLSKHIGEPAPSPADLGLNWLKGKPVTTWSKDRPTVLAYQPPINASVNWGKFPHPELWLHQLVQKTGAKADILEIIADQGLPFVSSASAPIINWPIARADWRAAGARLTDREFEWYSHIMVIDTSGRVAWIGGLESTGAAFVVERVADGTFDASTHVTLLRRAGEIDNQLRAARLARDADAADRAIEELNTICPWRRAELGQRRVELLVHLRRLTEAVALADSLIRGDCAGDFDSLQELDKHLFAAGVLVVEGGDDAARIKSLRARAMAAAADSLDQADPWSDAEAAKRYAEMKDWNGAVRWQSLALSYASESHRAEYAKTLESYIDRLEGRTPPEDISPMFRHK